MNNINHVVLGGRLTRDPEASATASGPSVLKFGIAVSEGRKDAQTGQWSDVAHFVDCTMFGTRAESLSRILRKGMPVVVDGRLSYSSWERDGQRRSKLEVIVSNVELPPKGDAHQAATQASQPAQAAPYDVYEDEIPF